MDEEDIDPLIIASFNTGQELYDWAILNNVLDNYFVQERLCHLSFNIPQYASQTTDDDQNATTQAANAILDGPDSPESTASSNGEFNINKLKEKTSGGKVHQCPRRCGAKFDKHEDLVKHRQQCTGAKRKEEEETIDVSSDADDEAGTSAESYECKVMFDFSALCVCVCVCVCVQIYIHTYMHTYEDLFNVGCNYDVKLYNDHGNMSFVFLALQKEVGQRQST